MLQKSFKKNDRQKIWRIRFAKSLFFVCNFILVLVPTFAQELDNNKMNFEGYSGGMMLHTGYLFGGKINMINPQKNSNIQGFPFGIGGVLRFHFGKHLRIGGEGYSSNLQYGKNKSFLSLGWGGFLVDCHWNINKFTVFCGGTIGGGSVKNVRIINSVSANSMDKNAIYSKYAIMLIDPFVGMEYRISRRINLIAKVDCIVNLVQKHPDFPTGTRVYAGFVFLHTKNLIRN